MNLLREMHPAAKRLNELRGELAAVLRQIPEIERAPRPDEEARADVRAAIASAQEKASDFGRFLYPPGPHVNHRLGDRLGDDTLQWGDQVALFGAEKVEEAIMAAIARAPGGRGLPAPKREAKLAQLRARVIELETAEEEECLRLEAEGFTVVRRGDIDARLVLGIWEAKSPPRAAPMPANPADKPLRLSDINEGTEMFAPPQNLA